MSYQHKMEANILMKPGVTSSKVAAALYPLARYWGWPTQGVLARFIERDPGIVELAGRSNCFSSSWLQAKMHEGVVQRLTIRSHGEVDLSYNRDNLTELAKSFAQIAAAGSMVECRDTAKPEIVHRIWISTPKEQSAVLEKQIAVDEAITIMVRSGIPVSDELLEHMRSLCLEGPCAKTVENTARRPRF